MLLYHGSNQIIMKPIYGFGKTTNDYGKGFYMTLDIELAKEWSSNANTKISYVNKYEIDEKKINILDLDKIEDKVLKWITLLVNYREFNLRNKISIEGKKFLINKYLLDVDVYDMIKGYRADDCYFMFAKSFLNNEISIEKLGEALMLGKLGNQYVLKSKKAFSLIKFIGYEEVDSEKYFHKRFIRNQQASKEYTEVLEHISKNEKYLVDILREEGRY